jgi:hypothetical protein
MPNYDFTQVSIGDTVGVTYVRNGIATADGDDAGTIRQVAARCPLGQPAITGNNGRPNYTFTGVNPSGLHVVLGNMRCTWNAGNDWKADTSCEFKD